MNTISTTFFWTMQPPEPSFTNELSDFLLCGWDRAVRAIRCLHSLTSNWDGAGGRAVDSAWIASAVRFCHVMREANKPAPSSVYPLSDGNIMLEWRLPQEVIVRFEIEGPGRGEFMTTYPDGQKATFQEYHWADTDGTGFQKISHANSAEQSPRVRFRQPRQDLFTLAA